jgi:lipoprotein-anchoring transpeptidase ErfK/SrfK
MHKVKEKIGNEAPLGSVFRGRIWSGTTYWEEPDEEQIKNLITTRILRLHGLEPGLNQGRGHDSFERYIYIHGTNQEAAIGTPSSQGCIQMGNEDIMELFAAIPEDTLVWIIPPTK